VLRVKRLVALLVGAAFGIGTLGVAGAQAPAQPEQKPAEKAAPVKAKTLTASGTVKTAAADSVVVAGKVKGKETEWTFAVDANTKIKKGGKEATAADLQAGDRVSVRYVEKEGKTIAQSITVSAPMKKAEAKKEEKK
jgi:hypothetical protein